jgi:WD40 repeat protein
MDFGFNCSSGSLKCVAVSARGKYLCCGGTDERIRIFNVVENRSMGELGLHEGAITSLAFFDDSHMISGSEDMSLRIWRCHDWECLHVLHGHKGAITSVAIHPTGKLALSVSKDNTMKLWNLIQGRCSFTRRLKGPADKVFWHPSGQYYMLVVTSEVQVYRASDNVCTASIKHKTRVNQAVFCMCGREPSDSVSSEGDSSEGDSSSGSGSGSGSSSLLRVASVCEDKTLLLHTMEGVETARLDVKDLHGRPRDMWGCSLSTSSSGEAVAAALEGEGDCLALASSQGKLVVISCRAMEEGHPFDECALASAQVKAEPRLTCIVSWSNSSHGAVKSNSESSGAVTVSSSKGKKAAGQGTAKTASAATTGAGAGAGASKGGKKIDKSDKKDKNDKKKEGGQGQKRGREEASAGKPKQQGQGKQGGQTAAPQQKNSKKQKK